jgi:hypothetical protein
VASGYLGVSVVESRAQRGWETKFGKGHIQSPDKGFGAGVTHNDVEARPSTRHPQRQKKERASQRAPN